jgi:lysine 2,3-aminomutase
MIEHSDSAVTTPFSGCIETVDELARYIDLTPDEAAVIEEVGTRFPWRITRSYAELMDPTDRACPLRLQAVPTQAEIDDRFSDVDPLAEEQNSPVPGVIRVYPDRIAVIATPRCPLYCRHCLRKRLSRDGAGDLTGARFDRVVSYIRNDPAIRDVLITGGDPLMLDNGVLDSMLDAIRRIDHVEIVRIGTRVPCTQPERITGDMADMLARHHPLWVSTQFNHPRELSPAAVAAIDILLSWGIPVNNQSVLLRGVNDDVDVMRELVQALVRRRIRPYYIYQAQTLAGTGRFVCAIERGLDIINGLRGWTTGFAVPQFVLDTPFGKVPLNPARHLERHGDWIEMDSYDGRRWREYNPPDA